MKRPFPASVWKEGDWYVSQCLEVDVASLGETEEEAIQSDPDYSKTHASLGILLVRDCKFAEAIPHLLEAGDAHGAEQARVFSALGAPYQNTGDAVKASETLALARAVADVYGRATARSVPAR